MTPAEYRSIRKALGLTHAALAATLSVNLSTTQRWEAGEREIPPAVAKILKLLDARRLTVDDVKNA